MTSIVATGRLIGACILAGYVADIANNFFIQPMIRQGEGPMGLFAGAAGQPGLIGAVVLIVVAYGPQLWDMISNAAYNAPAPATRPW